MLHLEQIRQYIVHGEHPPADRTGHEPFGSPERPQDQALPVAGGMGDLDGIRGLIEDKGVDSRRGADTQTGIVEFVRRGGPV